MRNEVIEDEYGNVVGELIALGSPVYASRNDVSDAEKFAGGTIESTLDARFTVRSSPFTRGITPGDRLINEGLDFDIIGIKQAGGRRAFLELSCKARV